QTRDGSWRAFCAKLGRSAGGGTRLDDRINRAALKLIPQRRHAAQFGDDARQSADSEVDFWFGVLLAEREENVALRQRVVDADGLQHGRHFESFADATGATGHGQALHVRHQSDSFTLDEFKTDIEVDADAIGTRFRSV